MEITVEKREITVASNVYNCRQCDAKKISRLGKEHSTNLSEYNM